MKRERNLESLDLLKRWKWGPEIETRLDELQFVPNMTHVVQSLKILGDVDASMSLFQWTKRQPWSSPNEEVYLLLIDGLNKAREFDRIQLLFDDIVQDSGTVLVFNRELDDVYFA